MERQTVETFLLEFETSWQQIFTIDNRRAFYFLCFTSIFFVNNILTVVLLTIVSPIAIIAAMAATILWIAHILFGHFLIGVYESERAANVRYRKKINLLREILLSRDDNELVRDYLTKKELGIKTYSGSGNEIDKLGGTLKQIYSLIRVQQCLALVLIFLIWAPVIGGR